MTPPIQPDRIYRAREVARLVLDHAEGWFSKKRRRLELEEGFPRPISSVGLPRWYGQDLIDWLRRRKEAPRFDPASAGPGVRDLTPLLAERARAAARRR